MADSIIGLWVIQLSAAARSRAFARSILAQDSLRGASVSVEKPSLQASFAMQARVKELFQKGMT
jgi:hypothetical protein